METPKPQATVEVDGFRFPPFDLKRLLTTVFVISEGERFAVFTDLANPRDVKDHAFVAACGESQRLAYEVLYRGLVGLRDELRIAAIDFYAYAETGGSNLDLPNTVWAPDGRELDLRSTLARYTIALFAGTWSATAPATKLAKELSLRGATMHGMNDKVMRSGLAVDYREVSARAERLRKRLTRSDASRFTFDVAGAGTYELTLHLGQQEAQKSHGLVHTVGDIANLPAGEVYFVPTGAEGCLPQKFENDDTIAVFKVLDGAITGLEKFVSGHRETVDRYLARIAYDPNAGRLTELGLGTQTLPFAGCDIQDEKILGTAHVATGRSDHLGGNIDGNSFRDRRNAMHNDILFSIQKTPEIRLKRVVMERGAERLTIIDDARPTEVLTALL